MALVPIKSFSGEFPRQMPHTLPGNAAQAATDCDFLRGHLTGILTDGASYATVSDAQTVYVPDTMTGVWYAWNRDVDAVRGPVANDAYNRFYWTDGTNMYVSQRDIGPAGAEPAGTNKWVVGVPRPETPATVVVGGFALPFVDAAQPATWTAFCEASDGTRSGETVVYAEPVSTESSVTYSIDLSGVTCGSVDGGGVAGSGTALLIGVGEYAVPDGAESTPDQGVAEVFQRGSELLFRTSENSTDKHSAYFAYNGASYAFTWLHGYFAQQVYKVSGTANWWSTVDGATAPTGVSSSLTTGASGAPSVEYAFVKSDGSPGTAVFRPSGAELPSDWAGIQSSVTVADGVMTVVLTADSLAVESRAYTYTYVNSYGEEGPAAEPVVVDALAGTTVTLTYGVSPPGYAPIQHVRVYRTATGGQGTDYLYVGEADYSPTTPAFLDDVLTENLGEPLSTEDFVPPEAGLKGLISIGNGMLAAFRDNEVHVSRPYLPYAWKSSNIQTMPSTVVGLCAFENSIYVTTTTEPVLISGVDPDNMTNQKLPAAQAGVSKWSICNVGPYVAFASHDGIVLLRALDASLALSQQFFTRDVWRHRYGSYLSTMRFAAHDGNLLVYGPGITPFLVRFEEENPSLTSLSHNYTCHAISNYTDSLYVVRNGALYQFKGVADRVSRKPASWWSKDFITAKPLNFGLIQIVGSGSVTVSVYADGVLKFATGINLSANDRNVLRLPSGFLASRWSISLSLTANAYVTECYVATSTSELQGV